MKDSSNPIGNRTRDLSACSAVPGKIIVFRILIFWVFIQQQGERARDSELNGSKCSRDLIRF